MAIDPQDELLTPAEILSAFKLKKGWLYQRLARNEVPLIRFGRLIRIPKRQFLEWFARQTQDED